jgi:hypothetical protein
MMLFHCLGRWCLVSVEQAMVETSMIGWIEPSGHSLYPHDLHDLGLGVSSQFSSRYILLDFVRLCHIIHKLHVHIILQRASLKPLCALSSCYPSSQLVELDHRSEKRVFDATWTRTRAGRYLSASYHAFSRNGTSHLKACGEIKSIVQTNDQSPKGGFDLPCYRYTIAPFDVEDL